MADAPRPISTIAHEIPEKWYKVGTAEYAEIADKNRPALPYVRAMTCIKGLDEKYGADDARDIVQRFLSNAAAWRGEDARRIKAELNAMLKGA